MREQEQIEEMANYYCEYCKKQTGEKFCEHIDDKSCNIFFEAELFYNAGYRKAEEVRKETAKEILQRVVTLCKNEEDFQDGHVNTQLEPLFFGIANGCAYIRREVEKIAKEYRVEVEK